MNGPMTLHPVVGEAAVPATVAMTLDPIVASVNGGTGVTSFGVIVNAGTNFSFAIETSMDGTNWYNVATVTHVTTGGAAMNLSYDLKGLWPMIHIDITDDTGNDLDIEQQATILKQM